ncbi:MAG: amino acid aldolase [bacterium]|nr:amino acid aldolase [bacterium]
MIKPGTKIEELDTPALIVDLDKMERNIRTWQEAIGAEGVSLRPHVKTHKIPEIALMQLKAGAGGITVAKVSEAEVFASAGIRDIFIAYPVIGKQKWEKAAHLARFNKIIVGVDSETGARGLSKAAAIAGSVIRVRVEINMGQNRSGVLPENAEALCRLVLSLPSLELDGIFGFRSLFFAGANNRPAEELGREEGEIMAALAEELRSSEIPVTSISIGSTPTARFAAAVPGITEVRPGTYIFGDYMMAELGAVSYDDIALSILCTVISRPVPGRAAIDGGSKTFCGDVKPDTVGCRGYARAVGRETFIESMTEEHGVLSLEEGHDPGIGEKIALYPIHVCTAINLCDRLIGVRNGLVEKSWFIHARGKNR